MGHRATEHKCTTHTSRRRNNKQHAQRLNEVRAKDMDYFREHDDETDKEVRDRLKQEEYETWICLDLRDKMKRTIDQLRDQLQTSSIKKKKTRNKRHKLAEEIASKQIRERRAKGITGESDKTIIVDRADRIAYLVQPTAVSRFVQKRRQ